MNLLWKLWILYHALPSPDFLQNGEYFLGPIEVLIVDPAILDYQKPLKYSKTKIQMLQVCIQRWQGLHRVQGKSIRQPNYYWKIEMLLHENIPWLVNLVWFEQKTPYLKCIRKGRDNLHHQPYQRGQFEDTIWVPR